MMNDHSHPIHGKEARLAALIESAYGLSPVRLRPLPGELDLNAYLETTDGRAFTLKLARPGTERVLLDMQDALLRHLKDRETGLHLPAPVLTRDGDYLFEDTSFDEKPRLVRLMHWVPGRVYAAVKPHDAGLLESLGDALGRLSCALQGFDHPAAHRWIKWDPAQAEWSAGRLHFIEDDRRRALATHFLDLFRRDAAPRLMQLRYGTNHNDANDYNILVSGMGSEARVSGIIDFGDAVHTPLINELAITLAYALMDHADPLAAAVRVVQAYHRAFPLREDELAVLFPLIGARLLLSVVHSAINRHAEPENAYLLISEEPAWRLLERLQSIPAALAHYTFRQACGREPCPSAGTFRRWAAGRRGSFAPVIGRPLADPQVLPLDLSVGSLDLGNNENFMQIERFDEVIQQLLKAGEAMVGAGGYGEVRPFYTTDAYVVQGNEGPQWRTVHLGFDIWTRAGTLVHAPLDGVVHSLQDNARERDYGPTIILEHQVSATLTFYTLYGHLSRASLHGKKPGMPIKSGAAFAEIGPRPENGNWPPHLHFQVMLDMLGLNGDFPGVGFYHERAVWQSLCPDPALLTGYPQHSPSEGPSPEALQGARRAVLGPNLSLSYRQPLHMLRGYRQYLYDRTGRRYLDTVNNVAHVGHEHPRVVRAAQRQLAVLNTNTRYLHAELIRYAEELTATLPAGLCVAYFVNSGSEANELALRMARTATGREDMVALKVGYHGNTGQTIAVSSYKFEGKGGGGAPPTTHVAPIPDPFRGPYKRSDPRAGARYALLVREVIRKAEQNGCRIAGFIGESILSCGGQVVPPEGFLADVYRYIRQAGGLCIADEVQTGFGRVGDRFWAFEQQGVVPDIVTMGKPIGNGHPLGAVVCTRSVAETFHNGMEYFNTFGGNPVSCAVGRAVLAVIREEGLQQNALETGAYLREGLLTLQERHPLIGEVRGSGLFQGIELIRHPDTLAPATEEAAYLADRMRAHGILMSTDGPYENVLKIKPPICFSRRDADFLIEILDGVLGEDGCKTKGE